MSKRELNCLLIGAVIGALLVATGAGAKVAWNESHHETKHDGSCEDWCRACAGEAKE